MADAISAVAALMQESARVLFITGAGVSAESGIPTFRGSTAAFTNGLTAEGVPFEEALSSTAFWRNPAHCWQHFFRLEETIRGKQPNPAHQVIASLQKSARFVCVVTQNIDGLHRRAGSSEVVELHGNLLRIICTDCPYQVTVNTFECLSAVPHCPQCGQLLRPDIVLYEEALPEAALRRLEFEQAVGFDLVFSVGTTSVFNYVVLPLLMAARQGRPTVEINPDPTPISQIVKFRFASPAGETLEKLWTAMAGCPNPILLSSYDRTGSAAANPPMA